MDVKLKFLHTLFGWMTTLGGYSGTSFLDFLYSWTEQNRCSFEDTEKMLVKLKDLCQCSLFDWSQWWSFKDCSSLSEFVFS